MSSLCFASYSVGSSLTQTGFSSMLELLETIGNSGNIIYIGHYLGSAAGLVHIDSQTDTLKKMLVL